MRPSYENIERKRDPDTGVTYPMTVLVRWTNRAKGSVATITRREGLDQLLAMPNVESVLPLTRTGQASSPHLRVQ